MQPIQIRLRRENGGGETIEIASGDFLGHQVGQMTVSYEGGSPIYNVNGDRFYTYEGSAHAMVAAAYDYVAHQLDDSDQNGHPRA